MKKLLHERLRDSEGRMFLTCNTKDLSDVSGCGEPDCGLTCGECRKRVFNALADAIEHYYIPRPRFEDGEPIQFGEEVDTIGMDSKVTTITFSAVDTCAINASPFGEEWHHTNEPFKRPSPKVLDADGVEIKVGDTVYGLENGGLRGEVRYLHSYGVQVNWDEGYRSDSVNPEYLTHKEPDSLEKLRDDIHEYGKYVHIDENWDEMTGEWVNRLSALIERGK